MWIEGSPRGSRAEVAVRGDGRVLEADENLWLMYMERDSLVGLVGFVERAIGVSVGDSFEPPGAGTLPQG